MRDFSHPISIILFGAANIIFEVKYTSKLGSFLYRLQVVRDGMWTEWNSASVQLKSFSRTSTDKVMSV
jgi:hypothetical protein